MNPVPAQPALLTHVEVIDDMIAGFDTEARWTQGAVARTRHRALTEPTSADACCWCIMGKMEHSLQRVPRVMRDEIDDEVSDLLDSLADHPLGVPGFNDDALTEFKDVLGLLSRARGTLQPAASSAMSACL